MILKVKIMNELLQNIQEVPERLKARTSLYGFEMTEPDLRFTNRDSSSSYNIKSLWQRNHEIIGLKLQGHSNKDIALMLDVTPQTVSNTLNSEMGIEKISKMREKRDEEYIDVSKRTSELLEKAMKIYEEIFDSPTVSYNLKKAAADTVVMDIGGHRAPTKVQTQNIQTTATLEEIESFKQRGKMAAKEAGFLIEIPEGDQNEFEK